MSGKTSGRKEKLAAGNRKDLPHMQSSLSPQGFGLYNYAAADGGGGGERGAGDAPFNMNDIASLKDKADSFNNYFNGVEQPPIVSSNPVGHLGGGGGGYAGSGPGVPGWGISKGNENLPSNNFGGGNGPSSGNYLNATSPSDSPGKRAIMGMGIGALQERPGMAGRSIKIPGGGSSEMDRDLQKERLIDSLSQSDITCLPGFKKRTTQFSPPRRKIWEEGGDKLVHRISPQQEGSYMTEYPSAPSPTIDRNPMVPSSSYSARQTPASSYAPILNYPPDKYINDDDGYNFGEASINNINPIKIGGSGGGGVGVNVKPTRSPPCSPITRAKAAIGHAQGEILKINTTLEEDRDRKKPPGAWKNMGTPFFSGSEPMVRSAQRQQKAQYRLDLERQIMAGKMRKAEQERREKDGTDHPLGPDYSHPALTYYNNNTASQKPFTNVTAAALTKYMQGKYALGDPYPPPRSTRSSHPSSVTSSPRYPQESGINGSFTARSYQQHQQQQAKMEKVSGGNLMRPGLGGAVQVGDQNQGLNTSPRQIQPHLQQHQQFKQRNVAGAPFNQQRGGYPPQYGYPAGAAAGIQQHPQRQQYGYGMNGWPMYQHPGYMQCYGQFASGTPIPQQQHQYYQQQNHNGSSPPTDPSAAACSSSPPLPHLLDSSQFSSEFGGHGAAGGFAAGRRRGNEDDEEIDVDDADFEELKEKVYKAQKIWQTSDELPDAGLRTAVYKVELRKQIDEDRKRKAERLEKEKLEDDRIEKKIKEFQEEERRRMVREEKARAELEELEHRKMMKPEQQKHRKKNEAFTISQNSGRMNTTKQPLSQRNKQKLGPRTTSPPIPSPRQVRNNRKGCHHSEGGGDYDREMDEEALNDKLYDMEDNNEYGDDYQDQPDDYIENEDLPCSTLQNLRKGSPPVPVVQRKLLMKQKLTPRGEGARERVVSTQTNPEADKEDPRDLGFLGLLKERLKSERDLVERRLKEKVESTHKNLNLLKYVPLKPNI